MKSCYVAQLAWAHGEPPASRSWVLELQTSATTPSSMSQAPDITVPLGFHFGIFSFNIFSYLRTLAQPASRGQSPVPVGWFYTCFSSMTAGLLYSLVSHLWIPFIRTPNLCFPLDIFFSFCPRQFNTSVYTASPCIGAVKMTLNIWEDVCTCTVCPGTRDLNICRLWCLWASLESPRGTKGCTLVSRFNVKWRKHGLVISLRLPVSYPVCLVWDERLHT